jgi:hypothetical protein
MENVAAVIRCDLLKSSLLEVEATSGRYVCWILQPLLEHLGDHVFLQAEHYPHPVSKKYLQIAAL